MNELNKKNQIKKISSEVEEINDAEIFTPESATVLIGSKKCYLAPTTLTNMRYLSRLSNLKIGANDFDETKIDELTLCLSKLLNETDTQFLEDNITPAKLEEIFEKIAIMNSRGIPKPNTKDKKNEKK